jgi:hypothetical protein
MKTKLGYGDDPANRRPIANRLRRISLKRRTCVRIWLPLPQRLTPTIPAAGDSRFIVRVCDTKEQ